MLLVAAICAVLFHGAFSTPSPSSNLDDDLIRSDNDNEESDQNPMLIYLAKGFIKVSMRYFMSIHFIESRGGPNVNTTPKYLIRMCCLFHLTCMLCNVSSYITDHILRLIGYFSYSDAYVPWNPLLKSAESDSYPSPKNVQLKKMNLMNFYIIKVWVYQT